MRRDDGSYGISGQKIFITWGEHDIADNIVHLVLARTPDAPPGTQGISLFIVPKYPPEADGRRASATTSSASRSSTSSAFTAQPDLRPQFATTRRDRLPRRRRTERACATCSR